MKIIVRLHICCVHDIYDILIFFMMILVCNYRYIICLNGSGETNRS